MRLPRIPSPAVALALAGALVAPPATALTAQHRLGHEVVPTFESLRLDLDAGKPGYSGTARIALKVATTTDSIQLHARDLELVKVTLRAAKKAVPVSWTAGEHGILTVRAAAPLAPGAATLELEFTNDFDTRANSLYRLETGGHAYAFTQFETIAAREAFPCFDEPEFKIPWQLTLTVPRAHLAISNTPVARDTVVGAKRRITFEKTPPLPSYLLAIATGPLETVPIPGMGVPGRVVTVKGRTKLAGEAVKTAPRLLAALERYFGRKYPYRKLDLLAVPEFWAGAMENPGAITFREERLLLDPKQVTAAERRHLVTTMAHELAHMWFGDLVTMEWWDDIWLNESFASWMGDKVSHEVYPEFDLAVEELRGTQRALLSDAQPSTHAIRQSFDAFDPYDRLFDELSYSKGQAVLGMLEQWLGPEMFRAGVRDYIAAHAWGNAVGADLWNALSKASWKDVSGVATSFLDQGGAPLVTVTPLDGGRVELVQSRFANYGAQVEPARWRVPVTLRYAAGDSSATLSVLLADSVQTVTLEGGATPRWIVVNADARGYFRWRVPAPMLSALAEGGPRLLTPRERADCINDIAALLDAGLLHGDEALRLFALFGGDPEPEVVASLLDALEGLRRPLVGHESEKAFAFYVRRTLGGALDRIGAARAEGEPTTVTELRARLTRWLAEYGRDPNLLSRAQTLAEGYLADPASVDASLASVALDLAAQHGDSMLFERLRQGFETSQVPAERQRYLQALASFRDTALVARALAYALSGPLRPQEIGAMLRAAGGNEKIHDLVFRWVMDNFDAIAGRMPPYARDYLVYAAGGCSVERLQRGRAFFGDPKRTTPGMAYALTRVADWVSACVGLRERESAAAGRYLAEIAGGR